MQRVCVFDSESVRTDLFDPDDLPPVLNELQATHDDVQVLPVAISEAPPELVIMDMDSTLIEEETVDMLAHVAGIGERMAAITARTMAGEIDFETSLRSRTQLLAGMDATVLADIAGSVTLTTGVEEFIDDLHDVGCTVAVVSGGYIDIVSPVAIRAGADHAFANTLDIADGKLTGALTGTFLGRDRKAHILSELAAELGTTRTVAIGDGSNDLAMIEQATCGVAFCAKPILAEFADLIIRTRDMRLLSEIFCAPFQGH